MYNPSRLFIVLLIIVLITNMSLEPVQANPLVLPSAELVIKLLIAAGVTFASTADMTKAYDHFGLFAPSPLRDLVNTHISLMSEGIVNVSEDLWNGLKSYVSSYYNSGVNNVITSPQQWPSIPSSPSDAIQSYQVVVSSGPYYYLVGSAGPMYYQYGYLKTSDNKLSVWMLYQGVWHYQTIFNQFAGVVEYANSTVYKNSDYNSTYMASTSSPSSYTYTGQPYVKNTSQTFTNVYTGSRSIPISTTGDLTPWIGTTTADIENVLVGNPPPDYPPISYPMPLPVDGLWQGTWTGTFGQVGTFDGTYTPTGLISVPWEVDWEGSIPLGFGFPLTWTGEFPISTGILTGTQTGTVNPPIVDPLNWTVPESLSINFQPLIVPFTNFKDKFPFCIPWDIYNSIKTLNVPAQVPVIEFEFPESHFVGGGTVRADFGSFEPIAKILRWSILIVFNYALIINTRKYIGAGGD